MGLSFRKRIKITDNLYLNISKSGISVSVKGKNLTVNSRGTGTIALGKGNSIKVDKSGIRLFTKLN